MPLEQRQRSQIVTVGTAFLRARPIIVAPAMACFLGVLLAVRAPRLQICILATAFTLVLTWFLAERRVGRTRIFGERALLRSLLGTLIALSGLTFLTGAMASPALPLLFAPVGIGLAAFGRARAGKTIFGGLLLAVAVLYLVPITPFPPLPSRAHRLLAFVAFIDAVILLRVGIASLSDAHAAAAASLATARDEVIAASRARTVMIEQLGANVAHEVKNPLAAVRAIVELSIEQADARGRRRLEVAASEVTRIESILNDYLSFARPVVDLVRVETDVAVLAKELAIFFESRAERAGITLRTAGDPLLWMIDPKGVKEALVNLLVNAFDATSAGGEVILSWCQENTDLVVVVVDSGHGMSQEALERIGKRWDTGRERGTGLGVALVEQVAVQHGGKLTYESSEGVGTRAVLRLPLPPPGT